MSPPSHDSALLGRSDLRVYGNNARLLFALETRLRLQDIHTVAANSLTDGRDDKKCDLVYIDRGTGLAIIAQGYESQDSSKPSAKSNKAADLNTAVSWLIARPVPDLPKILRSAATELRSAIVDGDVRTIQCWYVHNLPESDNVGEELATVEQTLHSALKTHHPGVEFDELVAVEVGRETLEEWYSALDTPILVRDRLELRVSGAYELHGDGWSSAVTSVPASWLHGLYETHGVRLFSANVRDYLGSRRSAKNVNHNIKRTAVDHPGKFWAYNNGITALVNEFKNDGGTIVLQGISIVNGAQTTGAIGSLGDPPDSSALVPARFVRCSDSATVQKIIQYNNTQNAVKATDFRSNDPIQRRLRQEFEAYDGTTYHGGRRGGDVDKILRPGNVIPTDTCSQALAAFHQDPNTAYNRKSAIWEEDGIYSKYFFEATTAAHIVFAFSLLRVIEDRKRCMMLKQNRTDHEDVQLDFLRNRGATFLLCTAIAACVETYLDQAVPNKFRLNFGTVSVETAMSYWGPVVDAAVPFCSQMQGAIGSGFKSKDSIVSAVRGFRSMVEATKTPNSAIFAAFQAHVIVDA